VVLNNLAYAQSMLGQHAKARELAYQMVRQETLQKSQQISLLKRQNEVLQLQQRVDRQATQNSRLMVALLALLVASIGMTQCLEEAPFCLAHHPPSGPREDYVLCGHIHPGFRFVVRGHRSQTAACFWFTAGYGVLPAFGSFTGLALVEPAEGGQVFLCTHLEVIRVPC